MFIKGFVLDIFWFNIHIIYILLCTQLIKYSIFNGILINKLYLKNI